MYTRILVPLDGSPLAEQVLSYVRILAGSLQTPVELLRMFQLSDPTPGELADLARIRGSPEEAIVRRYLEQVIANSREEAQNYLDRVRSSLEDLGVPVSSAVHEGEPASYIVNEAETEQGTLIAMSTHGRSGVTRWVLGSVTDKVLHATTNPLLIIRARPQESFSADSLSTRFERWASTFAISNVMVPLDGSALAEQVLPHVVALAKGMASTIRLVRATPSEETDRDATEYLQQVGDKLRREGVPAVEEQLLHGDAANAILDKVQQSPDALVAVTTHGRSGLGRWIMGSVTDRIVRYSGTPVLVIRGA